MKTCKDKYKLVTEYKVTAYRCGLKAGDRVRLKKDIEIKNHDDLPTGKKFKKGDVWTVIPGSKEGRIDVWFRQSDGQPHTWDDDSQSITEWFEVLK